MVCILAGGCCGTTRMIFFSSSRFSSFFLSFQPSNKLPNIAMLPFLPRPYGSLNPAYRSSKRRAGRFVKCVDCGVGGEAEADCMLERERSNVVFAVSDHPRCTGGGLVLDGLGSRCGECGDAAVESEVFDW